MAIVGAVTRRPQCRNRRAGITGRKSEPIGQCRRGVASLAQTVGKSEGHLRAGLMSGTASAAVAEAAAVNLGIHMERMSTCSAIRRSKERCPTRGIRIHHHGRRVYRRLAVATRTTRSLDKAVHMQRFVVEGPVSIHMSVAAIALGECFRPAVR